MTPRQLGILNEIRSVLQAAYAEYFAIGDCATKSDDGLIEVQYPPYHHEEWTAQEAYKISIYSYALGPSRMHIWEKGSGNSTYYHKYCDDPFTQALLDVREWQRENDT